MKLLLLLEAQATAAGFFTIIYQYKLSKIQVNQIQDEMENIRRPWLGMIEPEIYSDGKRDVLKFTIKNHGKIPARISKSKSKWSETKFYKENLISEIHSTPSTSVYMPQEEIPYMIHGQNNFMTYESVWKMDTNKQHDLIKSIKRTFYFGVILEYEYPPAVITKRKKKNNSQKARLEYKIGEYGFIAEGFVLENHEGSPLADESGIIKYGISIIDAWTESM